MGGARQGVEVRENSIRITFSWQGKARKETLKTNGEPMPPTPKNIAYAERLAEEIRQKIRHGAFQYSDYFPASRHATTGMAGTVADQVDLWLSLQTGKEASTIKGYTIAAAWWKARIGGKTLTALVHSDILAALATEPAWTGKTRNNKVSVLRQALALAIRDRKLQSNPLEGLEAAKHQKPAPDPFTKDEADAIVADMLAHYPEQVGRYFEAKFFTGLRTSESLGLRWDSIDWPTGTLLVQEAIVLGQHKDRTKTHSTRSVHLNSRALAALKAQKAHSFLLPDGWVWTDPQTGKRWVDDWTPREMYWRRTLKRLGIRYRSPYQTRHTYATMMLMAGMAPAFGARQLGHSVEQFLRTYSKWIDGGANDAEMRKLEVMLSGENPGERSDESGAA
jgi:integrase